MSNFRRGGGGGEASFRGRLLESGKSSYSFNQDQFPTLPSAKANFYSAGKLVSKTADGSLPIKYKHILHIMCMYADKFW